MTRISPRQINELCTRYVHNFIKISRSLSRSGKIMRELGARGWKAMIFFEKCRVTRVQHQKPLYNEARKLNIDFGESGLLLICKTLRVYCI